MAWLLVLTTIVGTVYGQLALKWQVDRARELPDGLAERATYLLSLLTIHG